MLDQVRRRMKGLSARSRRLLRRPLFESMRLPVQLQRAAEIPSFPKNVLVLIAVLWIGVLTPCSEAADYLYSWKPSTDPAVTSYGVYQRTADSPYEMIDEVRVDDLDDPAFPSYLVTGLITGNTYRYAATSISSSSESDLHSKTCITLNSEIITCDDDDDDNQATVFISCFINAAGERIFRNTAGRGNLDSERRKLLGR